jgi:lysozyme
MTIKGIDVSNWQGSRFNWEAEHVQGVQFAFIKATEGTTFLDPDFERNWQVAKERGLARGAYHFFHPEQSAGAQASWFLTHVMQHGLDPGDLLAVDLEDAFGLDPHQVAEAANEFTGIVNRRADASLIVYTTPGFALGGYCDQLGDSPLWLAAPGNPSIAPPPPWKLISFIQTGQRGIDQDTGYFEDVAQLRKLGVRAVQATIDQAAAAADPTSPATTDSAPAAAATTAGPTAAPSAPAGGAASADDPFTSSAADKIAGILHLNEAERLLTAAKTIPDKDTGEIAYVGHLAEGVLHALIAIGRRLPQF